MQKLLADRKILIEALSETVLLASILRFMGLDARGVETDARRLALRLSALNRKIRDGLD